MLVVSTLFTSKRTISLVTMTGLGKKIFSCNNNIQYLLLKCLVMLPLLIVVTQTEVIIAGFTHSQG